MLQRLPIIVWTTLGGAVVGLLLAMRYDLPQVAGLLVGLALGLVIGGVVALLNRARQREADAARARFPDAIVVSTRNDATYARGLGQLLPWSESSSMLDASPLVVFDRGGIGFWSGANKATRVIFVPWADVKSFKVGAKGEGSVLDRSPRQLLEFKAVKGERGATVAIPIVDSTSRFLDLAGVTDLVAEVKKLRG
jgi:hypothetical protein